MSLPRAEFEGRVASLRVAMAECGHDWLVVYGDDRHAENVRYLTGFAPAFEAALVLVDVCGGEPVVLAGVEGAELFGLTGRLGRVKCHVPFSAQGIANADDENLESALRRAGLRRGQRVGLVAERYLVRADGAPRELHFIPQVVWAAVVEVVGTPERVTNASHLLGGAAGLRASKSAHELVQMEAAAVRAARAIGAMLTYVAPGRTERELALAGLCAAGVTTFAFDPVAAAGAARSASCLAPPGDRSLRAGEPVAMYVGPTVEGYCGNVGRLGLLAASADELAPPARDVVERLHAPVAEAYATLLRAMRVGVGGGRLYDAVADVLGEARLGTLYSPCHLIGLAEWEDTYAKEGCEVEVQSGHVMQVDLAVLTLAQTHGAARIEDGFAFADAELRAALRSLDEDCWARIEARRARCAAAGIDLDETVLPLSDLAPARHSFLLDAVRTGRD